MAKYKDKNCALCGKRFTPNSANGKYCGADCTRQAKREKERTWRLQHRKPDIADFTTRDTEENVRMCLSCTQKKCTGWCKTLR